MPLVSVIVPVYNVENYVGKCIESICRQTYAEIEIILVDDGATDRSGSICDEYGAQDCRIQVIHKENGGLSDARNTGLASATGEYIVFVDSDDEIAPSLVEQTVACAEAQGIDIVLFDILEREEETKAERVCGMDIPRNQVFTLAEKPELLLTTPSACNKLYRRRIWTESGVVYPVGRNYEDLSTIPKLVLEASKLVYLDSEPLYYYTIRQGSIMRSGQFEKSYLQRKTALEDVIEYYKKQKQYTAYEKELEYLFFLHGYFIPSKEVVLQHGKKKYLQEFRTLLEAQFPQAMKNAYRKQYLSSRDKILLRLLRMRCYWGMNTLSYIRKILEARS